MVGLDSYACYCEEASSEITASRSPRTCHRGNDSHGTVAACDGYGCSLSCDIGYHPSGDGQLSCDLSVGHLEVESCDEVPSGHAPCRERRMRVFQRPRGAHCVVIGCIYWQLHAESMHCSVW